MMSIARNIAYDMIDNITCVIPMNRHLRCATSLRCRFIIVKEKDFSFHEKKLSSEPTSSVVQPIDLIIMSKGSRNVF